MSEIYKVTGHPTSSSKLKIAWVSQAVWDTMPSQSHPLDQNTLYFVEDATNSCTSVWVYGTKYGEAYLDDNPFTQTYKLKIDGIASGANVADITYDSTNKILKKTINGTTSSIITVADLKNAMELSAGDVGLKEVTNDAQVTNVAYDSTNHKLTQTINGTTSDVVTISTLKSEIGDATPSTSGLMTMTQAKYVESGNDFLAGSTRSTIDGLNYGPDSDNSYTETDVVHYASCSTGASTSTKSVTMNGFKLVTGAWIAVKFTTTNSAATSGLKLKVGSTDAKNIKYRNANLSDAGQLAANRIYFFVYDGTYWQIVGDLDTDTTYTSKAAASGGTDVSLVTTGEKYTWNSKTSNTGTVTKVSTGVGLTGGDITTTGTVKAKLRSETALTNDSAAATETSGRIYPVVPDHSGYLAVNVPWTDTNTQTITGVKGNAETDYRTGDVNLTPANLGAAPLASPALTGTPTAPTAANGTNNTQIATTAFVMNAFQANDAMVFKGTIGSSGATVADLPATHYQGWTYRVIEAGTYAGKVCEIGDMLICVTDGTSADNDHWTVVQTNIDGAVVGPASSVDSRVAVFDGTTGKLIKDSGFTIGTSVPSNAKFTDTNTKVTSAANHYAPATVSGKEKSASASGGTAAWEIDVVQGVTLDTDGKGHVTGISVTSGKIPANPDTDTHRPIKVDGTQILGNNTTALNLVSGDNISITNSSGSVTIASPDAVTVVDTLYFDVNTKYVYTDPTTPTYFNLTDYVDGSYIVELGQIAYLNNQYRWIKYSDQLLYFNNKKWVSASGIVSDLSITLSQDPNNSSRTVFDSTNTFAITAYTSNPENVSTTASAGSSTEYARGDHVHAISLATGDANGQVKIAGTNVDVKGLGTAAYTASTDYATSAQGTKADNAIPKSIGTAAGDIIYWSASGSPKRLAKGSNGQVLKLVSGVPAWANEVTDTDVNVTNTLANTTKAYVTGTTSESTNTGTQVFDSGVYVTTTEGQLNATSYKVNESVTMQFNSTTNALDFIFS